MGESVNSIPDGFQTITPYLYVQNAAEAIAFYVKAFGAVETSRLTVPNGTRVRHSELVLGDSHLFITDIPPAPETIVPSADRTSPVWLYLYVSDPDAMYDSAIAAGADVVTPIDDQPWGDRYGCVADPFGYRWAFASRKENLTQQELYERMSRFGDDETD